VSRPICRAGARGVEPHARTPRLTDLTPRLRPPAPRNLGQDTVRPNPVFTGPRIPLAQVYYTCYHPRSTSRLKPQSHDPIRDIRGSEKPGAPAGDGKSRQIRPNQGKNNSATLQNCKLRSTTPAFPAGTIAFETANFVPFPRASNSRSASHDRFSDQIQPNPTKSRNKTPPPRLPYTAIHTAHPCQT
jgi:hypothetical protein